MRSNVGERAAELWINEKYSLMKGQYVYAFSLLPMLLRSLQFFVIIVRMAVVPLNHRSNNQKGSFKRGSRLQIEFALAR